MKKGLTKLTKELLKNALHPITIDYPTKTPIYKEQISISDETRGKHSFDVEKCVGCGACTVICSSGAITESDFKFKRTLKVELSRCIFCGRCRDICPEKSIELTREFDLSQIGTKAKDSVKIEHQVILERCENCGRSIFPANQIIKTQLRIGENINQLNKETAIRDLEIYTRYCPDCRRTLSYILNIHPRKSY